MARRRTAVFVACVLLVAGFGSVGAAAAAAARAAAPAAAAPSGIDPGFGTDGRFLTDSDTPPTLDVANAAVDGAVVGSAGDKFAVLVATIRGFENGRPVIVDLPAPAAAYGVALVGGRIAAVGHAGDDFAIAQLSAQGDPLHQYRDLPVTTSFGAPAVAYGVADGRSDNVIAVGTVGLGAGSSLALASYGPDGELMPTFGAGGKVVLDLTPGDDSANAVLTTTAAGPGGPGGVRIVVAGQAGPDAFVARFLPDGTLDPSFRTGGRTLLDLTPGDDVAHAVSITGDGRILVAGSAGGEAFVARLSRDGIPDASFGGTGVVRTRLGGTAASFRGRLPRT